ncbi:MAG: hypothetical protein JO006_14365 [Paucibacter sp.]|nr:hypothetical protein [Roseateles sp.]
MTTTIPPANAWLAGGPPLLGVGALRPIEHDLAVALALVARRDRVAATRELRSIAGMRNLEAMLNALTRVEREGWGTRYPEMIKRWRPAISRWNVLLHLSAACRRAVGEAEYIADDQQIGLACALGRHGCFATEACALRVAANSLTRATLNK